MGKTAPPSTFRRGARSAKRVETNSSMEDSMTVESETLAVLTALSKPEPRIVQSTHQPRADSDADFMVPSVPVASRPSAAIESPTGFIEEVHRQHGQDFRGTYSGPRALQSAPHDEES